ncbi:DUF2179 domain-containing protein [Rhodohalobacter sulfatireducens]|uniref:UPF0316 protein L6773_16365 n=1 Tax=Rhodohalobacter sulfatireducens TaxID=2911366 RepID=A0ABS9KH65_9BACT|nr:DUF2179 domain-containing protein [Rhodohalobacter sulfatireducens]MCG2590152.1 DUF2179 domain-containing protein [Rhodohalobacter sulfatireducens]
MFSIFELLPAAYVPLFIFLARILDVSLGTLRIIFVSKGMRGKATILGFIEVLIWIVIVAQIFQNLDNWINYVAFAGGFATGTYIGMFIEERMKMGVQIFRIIVGEESENLAQKLNEAHFRVTEIDGKGKYGPVKILFTVAKRKRWHDLAEVVNQHAPEAFYSVEDVKHVSMIDEEAYTQKQDLISRMLKLKKGI